ncbi:arabinose ABC transporter permease [Massilia sp. Root418]|nr:arabinose ABC transporter permease [Massilia sp. Root418]
MLWCTWLIANVCMWMNDVAVAWMMTAMTTSPVWVALVQTASTLPVFLLGLPSGALADILDRRRYFIATQFWVAAVAVVLCAVVLSGAITPTLLLVLTFANGIGLAMRWPVFAAIVPELVPRAQLPAALALNGVSMNASRIVGPLLAGALIAGAGSASVFVLNAVLSVVSGFLIMRWRRAADPAQASEAMHATRRGLLRSMGEGLRFVAGSTRMKAALARIFLFFFHSTALLALLPLLARGLHGGAAGTFTVLLACMGAGTVAAALLLPSLRQALPRGVLVTGSALLQSATMLAVALSPSVYFAAPVMFVAGMAWISTANALILSVQMALPDWVRARGMSMYQMAIMGASAAGAALWGQLAALSSVPASLMCAAAAGALAMLLAHRLPDADPNAAPDAVPAAAPDAAPN